MLLHIPSQESLSSTRLSAKAMAVILKFPHWNPTPSFSSLHRRGSSARLNSIGDIGPPCLTPERMLMGSVFPFFVVMYVEMFLKNSVTSWITWGSTPLCSRPVMMCWWHTVSKALVMSTNTTPKSECSLLACLTTSCSNFKFSKHPGARFKPFCLGLIGHAQVSLAVIILENSLSTVEL